MESESCTFVIGSTEQLWGAGAAVGLGKGQGAGVLGVIAGRAQWRGQIRVVGVAVPVISNGVPALARPPHVICTATHILSPDQPEVTPALVLGAVKFLFPNIMILLLTAAPALKHCY